MNQFVAASSIRFAGAAAVRPAPVAPWVIDSGALSAIGPGVAVSQPAPASLPLTSSKAGNLFVDRNDASVHWYLPDFNLADDVDPKFGFAASQSGQDSRGNPFYTARLTFRMHKSKPPDIAQFAQSNPRSTLQEIPLTDMSVVLTSIYTDDSGQERQRTFIAAIADQGNGDYLLTFDGTILGASVIGLYQDLTTFGKAFIIVSASYQAWSPSGLMFAAPTHPVAAQRVLPMRSFSPTLLRRRPIDEWEGDSAESVAQPPVVDPLVQTKQGWMKQLPLGLKYKQDGYQLKYTVSTATIPNQVIRSADDLTEFSLRQSEFTELKALGDINQRYPSLSRAYIGVLSRTIVVIPSCYSIVRSHVGCAALCMALVDSAASDGSKCKFELDFTIAPEVSRIEFLQLAQEISNKPDLKDYVLKLPNFKHDNPPSTLQTTFKSGVDFTGGTDAHTFALSVSIHDDEMQTPAVANANLFIMRLSSNTGAELVGSMSLKLDDGYSDAVLSPIALNFSHTAGSDELDVQIDEASAQIKLTNRSPIDLQLSRYALIEGSVISVIPCTLSIPANGSSSVPLPANHAGLLFAADSQLVIPKPLTKSDTARFLNFQTADVQETQYVVAIDGSGVDFKKVDSILASITFSTLPNVAPRPLRLSQHIHSDSTHIVIPLENAVFTLPGTVNLTVHFVDQGISDLNFTVDNDFTSEPVLVLLQTDIEKNLPNKSVAPSTSQGMGQGQAGAVHSK